MLKKMMNHPQWGPKLGKMVAKYIAYTRNHSENITEPEETAHFFRQHNPFILSVWHGQFMLIPTIRPHDIKAKIVVGRHGDAELAAQVVSQFGVTPIRGSGAAGRRSMRDRGGAKVLKQAIKALKEGFCIVSTADVPPGPAQKAGQGILTMARLSDRPIIPAAIATKYAINFKSWSRLTINLPWSKCALVVGDPIFVPRSASETELEKIRLDLEAAMQKATRRAHQLVGRNIRHIAPFWERSLEPGLKLKIYQTLTNLAKPLAPTIIRWRIKRGKELAERQNERYGQASIHRPSGNLLWMHAASVGETNAILPLIKQLLQRDEKLNILITTGTITSAKLIGQHLGERIFHQFVPLDNKVFINRFLNHWRPDLIAFVESEVWPNHILEIKKRSLPLLLLNGRLSKRSYKRWFKNPTMARPLFGRFDKILAQGEVDLRRFVALGAENVTLSGNIKIDAPPPSYDPDELKALQHSIGERPLMVAASTHAGEEEIITEAHKLIAIDYPDFLTIIAPRHPQRGEEIAAKLTELGINAQLRSKEKKIKPSTNIYIADSIGELGLFYSLSKIAVIGGSFIPHGGQNPIEAIKLGANILTGPHIENFSEAYVELFKRGGAIRIINADELAAKTIDLLQNPSQHDVMSKNANETIESLSGAMDMTLSTIESYLTGKPLK